MTAPSARILKIICSTVKVGITHRRHTTYFAEILIGGNFVLRAHLKRDLYEYLKDKGTPSEVIEPDATPLPKLVPSATTPGENKKKLGPKCQCGCHAGMHAGRGQSSGSSFCLSEYCACEEFTPVAAAVRGGYRGPYR